MPPCVATMICERQRASCPACGARRQPGSSGGGVSSCPSSRPCAAIAASCLSWPWPLTFLSRFFLPVRIATHMSELRWKPIVKGRLSGARMTGRAANGSGRCAHLRRRRRAAVQLIVRQLGTGMPTSAGAAGGSGDRPRRGQPGWAAHGAEQGSRRREPPRACTGPQNATSCAGACEPYIFLGKRACQGAQAFSTIGSPPST